MNLEEVFESELSMRKTIWTKRGDQITRREVRALSPADVNSRTTIEITKQDDKNGE